MQLALLRLLCCSLCSLLRCGPLGHSLLCCGLCSLLCCSLCRCAAARAACPPSFHSSPSSSLSYSPKFHVVLVPLLLPLLPFLLLPSFFHFLFPLLFLPVLISCTAFHCTVLAVPAHLADSRAHDCRWCVTRRLRAPQKNEQRSRSCRHCRRRCGGLAPTFVFCFCCCWPPLLRPVQPALLRGAVPRPAPPRPSSPAPPWPAALLRPAALRTDAPLWPAG